MNLTHKTTDLLSRLSIDHLKPQDVTTSKLLITALGVLLNTIHINCSEPSKEQDCLKDILNYITKPDNNLYQWSEDLILKVSQKHIEWDDLSILELPETERFLLIFLGYIIANADNNLKNHQFDLDKASNTLLISENRQNRLKSLFTHPQQKLTFELKEFFQFIDDLQSPDQLLTKTIQYIQNHLRKIAPIQYRKLEDIKNFIKTLENESLTPLETVVIDIKNCLEATDPIIKLQESSYNCSNTLQKTKEFFKLSRFRIAVVGAFNQGKSTLLNAIVGEDIQPVRVIPCTSAITVLKYGEQKRVTCCYKNRKDTKQISLEEYKQIAAMSEDAAINHLSEEFAKSDIDEIIYEHDELEICKNGVELVDSPGLNQHPDATEITKRLLKDTDAVIFVLSAIQILTQQERELLKDIRNQLNGGKGNQPVSNLFILVNFMDHLDGDNEYQQIQKSAYILETGQDAIIQDKNQIHFISAKLAFNAIQKQKNNHENSNLNDQEKKYYQDFQFFIKHLEDFLANDRGIIKLQNSIAKIQQLIEDCQGDLKQFNAQLDQEKKKYDEKESQLLKDKEKIETICQQIQDILESAKEKLSNEVQQDWKNDYPKLADKIQDDSKNWKSDHNPVWEQRQIINDYSQKLNKLVLAWLTNWSNETEEKVFAQLETTYTEIEEKLQQIGIRFPPNYNFKTILLEQLNISVDNIEDGFWGPKGILGGLVGGNAAVGAAFLTHILSAIAAGGVVAIGLVPAILLVGGLGAIAASLGLGMLDIDGNKQKIKETVVEEAVKKLDKSQDEIKEHLDKAINLIFSMIKDKINKHLDDKKQNIQSRLKDYQESNQQKLKIINNSKDFINEQTIKLEGIQAKLDSMENNQVKQLISSNQV